MHKPSLLEKSHWLILELYIDTEGKFNYKEISDASGVSYSMVQKGMKLLEKLGYVRKVDTGRFVLNNEYEGVTNLKKYVSSADFVAPDPSPPSEKGEHKVYIRPYNDDLKRYEDELTFDPFISRYS